MKCAIGLAFAFLIGACGHDGSQLPGDGSGSGGSDDGSGQPTATLTSFVTDLIANQTADNTMPVAYESFASLRDPDGDANNTAAYASLF